MQKYIFSGNQDILNRLQIIYLNKDIIFSDNYNKLISLQLQDKPFLIAYICDELHPIDITNATPKLIFNNPSLTLNNTFSNPLQIEGKGLCDFYIKTNTDTQSLDDIECDIADFICMADTYEWVITEIKNNNLHIKFDGTFFSGGRGEDSIKYAIYNNDNQKIGSISFGENNNMDFELTSSAVAKYYVNSGWEYRTNVPLYNLFREIIFDVLERDDKDYYNAIVNEDGIIEEPCDYCDLSREDVINQIKEEREDI